MRDIHKDKNIFRTSSRINFNYYLYIISPSLNLILGIRKMFLFLILISTIYLLYRYFSIYQKYVYGNRSKCKQDDYLSILVNPLIFRKANGTGMSGQ